MRSVGVSTVAHHLMQIKKTSVIYRARGRAPADVLAGSSVDDEHEDKQGDEEYGCVGVRGKERRLEATVHGVGDHTPRDKEGGEVEVDAGERVHGGGTSKEEHGCHDDVGQESEHQEHLVGRVAPASLDDLLPRQTDRYRRGGARIDRTR